MRLQSITLTNFRQFAGAQTFRLNTDDDRPVSLIFGANGSGKTAFLNAFTWGLYGTMSADVEHQNRLISDSVWRALPVGDLASVLVDITFEHDSRHYRLVRGASSRKESDHQPVPQLEDPRLWTIQSDGSSEVVGAPQQTINTILPPGVSRFFFFNGERIENLVKKGSYAEVQKDIKVLLDLEQVERALVHLPKVDRKVTRDLSQRGGTASAIQNQIDSLRDEETQIRDEVSVLTADLTILKQELEGVAEALRIHAEVAPIQARREAVARELEEARTAAKTAEAERRLLVGTRGFLAFTETLGDKTGSLADGLYQRGALPAPLKREFVDQLLSDGICICGTPLPAEGTAHEHVKQWRMKAGLQAVETAWQQLRIQVPDMETARQELREQVAAATERMNLEKERVGRLTDAKSDLDAQLVAGRHEDVQALETKRLELESRFADKHYQSGAKSTHLETVQRQVEQLTNERRRAEVKDELAAKARERSDLVQAVTAALKEILVIREEDMRNRLDNQLKAIFASITHQNHVPRLSEGFELTLTKDVDGVQLPVPKSTGENQILSLSFVAAVSQLARQIRTERRAEGHAPPDAGKYPIVMDAAFGSLDRDYQQAAARMLAKMAPQVVVLVSKSQGLGEVVTELKPYVSNLGVIETHTTAPNALAEDIELNGEAHPYIRPADSDYSELRTIR